MHLSQTSLESPGGRIDEELGIEPDTFEALKERLEQFKEAVRSGGSPSQLLQKWLLRPSE